MTDNLPALIYQLKEAATASSFPSGRVPDKDDLMLQAARTLENLGAANVQHFNRAKEMYDELQAARETLLHHREVIDFYCVEHHQVHQYGLQNARFSKPGGGASQ
jgi:hypothetical protein